MVNDFRNKGHDAPVDLLEEVLQGVEDEKERLRLTKAWSALSGLTTEPCVAPKPSRDLEMIFKKGMGGQALDELMSDDELEMLAAAGTKYSAATGEAGIPVSPPGCIVESGRKNGPCHDDIAHGHDSRVAFDESRFDDVTVKDEDTDPDPVLLTAGAGSDVFYFSSFEGAETIPDFTPGEDSLQFGEGLAPDAMFISLDGAGDIVINFPGSTLTLHGVKGHDWGLHSDMMTMEQMTGVFLKLGWTDFISTPGESK